MHQLQVYIVTLRHFVFIILLPVSGQHKEPISKQLPRTSVTKRNAKKNLVKVTKILEKDHHDDVMELPFEAYIIHSTYSRIFYKISQKYKFSIFSTEPFGIFGPAIPSSHT